MDGYVYGLNHLRGIVKDLSDYEMLDIQLQCLTNLNLRQIIDITKAGNLYTDINGQKVPLHQIGSLMKEYDCDFYTIKNILS